MHSKTATLTFMSDTSCAYLIVIPNASMDVFNVGHVGMMGFECFFRKRSVSKKSKAAVLQIATQPADLGRRRDSRLMWRG